MIPPDRERGPARHRPSTINPHPAATPGEFGGKGTEPDSWECTVGAAADLAVATGQRVAIDTTDQLVLSDVIVLELAANGIDATHEPSYPATHGDRSAWVLSPGVVV